MSTYKINITNCKSCKCEFEGKAHNQIYCETCRKDRNRESIIKWNKENKEKHRGYTRKWVRENTEKHRDRNREFYRENMIRVNGENYSLKSCSDEMKPIIEFLITQRKIKRLLKEF